MKSEFLKVRLIQDGHSVVLDVPNQPDRVYEIVKDGLVSDCIVSFECIFEMED